ncbi:MAG: glycoside-pentoside-hexuronide (GPH):cation symporter [Ruminococcus sp.]|jgi:GPH family glycoside/pentoside/hexuronide:cation symporter|nr:glycoside-pentoside-hexuronide (GPH):cation symporter [Ruminococcus sp.]
MSMKKRTRWVYGLGNAGASFIWTFTGSFLTQYYTDSVLMSAAFIGTMMLIMRLADGITDILQGILIEKTSTRFGKARPWLLASIIPLIVTTVLVFNVPASLSVTGKYIYICITYFLMATVFYTMFSLGYWTMLPMITGDEHERNRVASASNICGFVAGLLISTVTVPFLNSMGGSSSQSAWRVIAYVFAGFALVFAVACALFTREKNKGENREPIKIKTSVKALLSTRYFYIALIFAVSTSMISAIILGAPVFYARDVLGNSNFYSLLALVYVVPTVIGIALAPKLYLKIGKKRVMALGCAVAILGRLIALFNPYSLIITLLGTLVSAIGMSMYAAGGWTLASDIVDYLEPKLGARVEGLATTCTSFGNKVGTGFGSAALGWALAIGGYNASLPRQSVAVQRSEIFLLIVIPIILCAVSFVMMSLWRIAEEPTKRKVRI